MDEMKKTIYIRSILESDVTESELKELTEKPSWELLGRIMDRAKSYTVPEIFVDKAKLDRDIKTSRSKVYEIEYTWKNNVMLTGKATVLAESEEEAKTKLNDYVRAVCPGYSFLKSIDKISESNTVIIGGQEDNEITEKESQLIKYIMTNMHWCPFKDESGVDFEKECVGFCEPGCKECIYRNISKL